MTWKEIKQAVEQAGVSDEDEICLLQCEGRDGAKTFHKTKLGKSLKLSEDVSEEREDFAGCAV